MKDMLRIECFKNGGIDVVRVVGDLDLSTVAAFETDVRRIIEGGARQILIDGQAMDFIDSAALGRLVAILKDLRSAGGRMAISNLKTHIRSTFQLIRLDRFVPLFNSMETALQSLSVS